MSASDSFFWPDVAHEKRVYDSYVRYDDLNWHSTLNDWHIEVHGDIYSSYQAWHWCVGSVVGVISVEVLVGVVVV